MVGVHPPCWRELWLDVGFIDKAPHPVLAGFEGTDNGVTADGGVFAGVAVPGIIAATDMSAGQAQAQVHPGVAGLQAFEAAFAAWGDYLDGITVGALAGAVLFAEAAEKIRHM
jgi:hypothetical protein